MNVIEKSGEKMCRVEWLMSSEGNSCAEYDVMVGGVTSQGQIRRWDKCFCNRAKRGFGGVLRVLGFFCWYPGVYSSPPSHIIHCCVGTDALLQRPHHV